jgi:serine/threonine protein kinase
MAPEQVEGQDTDSRSDISALGAVLFETVTGARRFQGGTPTNQIVTRCLAKDSVLDSVKDFADLA